DADRLGSERLSAHASENPTSEYADVGAQLVDTLAQDVPPRQRGVRRTLRRFRNWIRRHYGVRELIIPEKYRVDERHDVVVTYSSSLALVSSAGGRGRLVLSDILAARRRARLYASLLSHPGIGLLASLSGSAVHVESPGGRAVIANGEL